MSTSWIGKNTLFSVSGKEGIGERYILSFQNKDQKSTSVS